MFEVIDRDLTPWGTQDKYWGFTVTLWGYPAGYATVEKTVDYGLAVERVKHDFADAILGIMKSRSDTYY